MPLNPAPTIDSGLLLIKQRLLRSDMTRPAELEYALVCADDMISTFQDAIDDFQANFNANLAPDFDAEVSVLPPTGRGGDGTNVPRIVVAAGAAVSGGSAVATPPPQVAALIRKVTPLGGRKNRGRNYFPWFLNSANVGENGTINAASLVGLQTNLNTFLAQLSTDLTPMCIENRTFNEPNPPHFVTAIHPSTDNVTAYVIENIVASQRRRVGR